MKRRNFTVIARASLSVGPTDAVAEQARAAATALLRAKVAQRLREIERASRGLLGVRIADTATDTVFGQPRT